ncbi:MAG: ATPase, T2SS/T4P/T4SS family [Candidatus Micrarchaeota archaeon]|nr:ATPase, T2SS/T4P/T4SS family [Candidatus Micrarchaeota archaeon]
MCETIIKGNVLVFDCTNSPYEFMSPDFISNNLRAMATLTKSDFEKIRYEEQLVFELSGEKVDTIMSYVRFIRQVEKLVLNKQLYGREDDDAYDQRRKTLAKIYEDLLTNPLIAEQTILEYSEAQPTKAAFYEAYKNYMAWLKGILKKLQETKMYALVKQKGDLRQAFISLLNMKVMKYVDSLELLLPEGSKPSDKPGAKYELDYGYTITMYDVPGSESPWYVIENKIEEGIDTRLVDEARKLIEREMSTIRGVQVKDYNMMFDEKMREYRRHFVEYAGENNIPITPEQAVVLARIAASWVAGLGEPMEVICLDKRNVTDIYIDSENAPIYIDHIKFGICHTVYRYSSKLVDQLFYNILSTDKNATYGPQSPIVDLVLKRLNMRCHLQGPPATFGERQGALRLMKEKPFTYAEYLNYRSLSAFFAGYDDMMVYLGCSEAILGLKGVGKTAFTAAKMIAIGTKTRILPIQDIEEIPVSAYRKRGFHIGVMRSMASDKESDTGPSAALSLVALTSASLRMGDAALIINEVRSRAAIQGIINLLNTQPGVFVLYNLHAQSLKDIRDRLELVFGIPGASMFATDRYTFLKKVRFGRKSATYRLLGKAYESDIENKKFEEVFSFTRGNDIDSSSFEALFLDNPELNRWLIDDIDLGTLQKNLKIKFVPPALKRRSEERGLSPQQMVMQAAFKGKVYSQIYRAYEVHGHYELLEMDFVLAASSLANNLLREFEDAEGNVDYAKVDAKWAEEFPKLLEREVRLLEVKKKQGIA